MLFFREKGGAFEAAAEFVLHIIAKDRERRFSFPGVDPGSGTCSQRLPHPADVFRGERYLLLCPPAVCAAEAALGSIEKDRGIFTKLFSAQRTVVQPRLKALTG